LGHVVAMPAGSIGSAILLTAAGRNGDCGRTYVHGGSKARKSVLKAMPWVCTSGVDAVSEGA